VTVAQNVPWDVLRRSFRQVSEVPSLKAFATGATACHYSATVLMHVDRVAADLWPEEASSL